MLRMMMLKELLEEEEAFTKLNRNEETRILESLLIDLRFRNFIGEIDEKEWMQKSETLNLGLGSLRSVMTKNFEKSKRPVHPPQPTRPSKIMDERSLEETPWGKLEPEETQRLKRASLKEDSKNSKRVRRRSKDRIPLNRPVRKIKKPPALEVAQVSNVHCMNPWNPRCRNTDIELSIYYNGQLTPICRKCWEDISEKNIEWSGLQKTAP